MRSRDSLALALPLALALALSGCSSSSSEGYADPDPFNITTSTSSTTGSGGGASSTTAQSATVTAGIIMMEGTDGGGTPPGCGDGELADDEVCDDGNVASGDGCSDNCLALEPGFSCAIAGQPCIVIARCGDGVVAPSEQCDDGALEDGDGCSAGCRVELGSKCEGEPSTCTPTTCGDGVQEGAEACDDGNLVPFDGCSTVCLREPNCEGLSCTSDCGDGLLINEECDDGNSVNGDGCSSTCTIEQGFTCAQESTCEMINGECILRVPAIFRDFGETHPDFGNNGACNSLALNAVQADLNAEGRPVMNSVGAAEACLSTDENFQQWYSDSELSETMIGELVLFDNGNGGFVNRYGAQGEQFITIDPATVGNTGARSEAECAEACEEQAINGEPPLFDTPLDCDDRCTAYAEDIADLETGSLAQLEDDLAEALADNPQDDVLIAEIEAEIAAVQDEIAQLEEDAATCQVDCEAELADLTESCAATCHPCNNNPQLFCVGGEEMALDGTPLFFPVDSIMGATANPAVAAIPPAYGYNWIDEDRIFDDAPLHNFYFTSVVQYWFRYDENTNATLDFLGDDDVWVFLNGKLAVDLGGVHVPSSGSVTIDAASGTVTSMVSDNEVGDVSATSNATAEDFGLMQGNVYKISIFQAERKLKGSSYKLTLSGFEATPSDCTAICGDGILSFGEECDDGVNDGGYGECAPECKLGPFCGDGIVQEQEQCDNGPGGGLGCPNCRMVEVK